MKKCVNKVNEDCSFISAVKKKSTKKRRTVTSTVADSHDGVSRIEPSFKKKAKKGRRVRATGRTVEEEEPAADRGCVSSRLCQLNSAANDSDATAQHPRRLHIAGGFSWDDERPPSYSGAESSGRPDSESDDEVRLTSRRPQGSAADRASRAKQEEQRLYELERRRLEDGLSVETADDLERLVVASPDDSTVWIRYMAHFLQATEVEKARAVARRALDTINFRREEDKLNIYLAWINLESLHGSSESLASVTQRAVQANDMFLVYTRMSELHAANDRHDLAERQLATLARKMPATLDVWLRYGVFLMKAGRAHDARTLMQRALKSLNPRHHVQLISKFSQLEMSLGDAGRGCTMFDSLLASYPRRLDQWLVYVTHVRRSGDMDAARRVYERMSRTPLGAHRMRTVFKQWLEFEQEHGSQQQQMHVRQKARDYVQSGAVH